MQPDRLSHAIFHARKRSKPRADVERNRNKRKGSLIYFVLAGKYIKIGISSRSSLRNRLYTFRVSNPFPIRLLKVLYTSHPRRDERVFHRLLADYHIKGEWFLITNPAILELLGV